MTPENRFTTVRVVWEVIKTKIEDLQKFERGVG
jgi:hypothetical protein